MQKYICKTYGYANDPTVDAPDSGIELDTPFGLCPMIGFVPEDTPA
ncbi:hypothetical protein [Pseudanabaena sp. BC1403]|nr:hypothetical protein [Pseudanabaena sp. BC1403]